MGIFFIQNEGEWDRRFLVITDSNKIWCVEDTKVCVYTLVEFAIQVETLSIEE